MAVPFAEVDGMVRDVPTDFACRLAQGWLPQHSMIMGQEAKQVLNGETPAQMKKKRRAERRARSREHRNKYPAHRPTTAVDGPTISTGWCQPNEKSSCGSRPSGNCRVAAP
jgi:hypothetical protein